MKQVVSALALLGTTLPLTAHAGEARLTGMALQQIQAKDFEAPLDVAFAAVMTVLQDTGFRILSADKGAGLITATGSSSSYTIWAPFAGFRSKKKTPQVSAFVEGRSANLSRVRLSFVMSIGKSNKAFTDETPIDDALVYRDAFEKIEREIFVRLAMAAPTPTPPASKAAENNAAQPAVTSPTAGQ